MTNVVVCLESVEKTKAPKTVNSKGIICKQTIASFKLGVDVRTYEYILRGEL